MSLERYHAKRDFRKTPEPRGHVAGKEARALSYLIQKHAASHLHYDFRLELDGVLLSWAVPKGPSLDPADKRLAMHVEDHPAEYGEFEGIIPKGQYGGGTVMLWDRGTWTPIGDPRESYKKGHLKFELHGEKLRGRWALIRTRGRFDGKGDPWLLIKDSDEYAQRGNGPRIVEAEPNSIVSGRDLKQIAESKDRSEAGALRHPSFVGLREDKKARDVVREKAQTLEAPARESASTTKSARGKTSAARPGELVAGITLTHPDKLMFPEKEVSKLGLARYFEAVAKWMLPHLEGRPLSLVRCPDGWDKKRFFQKHANETVNPAVDRVDVPESGGRATYLAANSLAALVGLVQWGTIEMHPWGSRVPELEKPDRLIFDLDPAEDLPWARIVEAARVLRSLLTELGLACFLKTTGGKGLHIVVPVEPALDWKQAKAFTGAVARFLARTFPDRFTAYVAKAQRSERIFIDYLRNTEGATAIAPYGVRARRNAPVATPINWEELANDVRFDYFNVETVPARLKALKRDPWTGLTTTRQAIAAEMFRKVGATPPAPAVEPKKKVRVARGSARTRRREPA